MKYNTILFDADGTLLDFLRSEREAVKEAFAISGILADDDMIKVYSEINDSLWKMLERKEIERQVLLYHRFELFCERYGFSADAKKIASDYVNTLSTKGYLLDGARELLDALKGKVRMYIVTNGVARVQQGRYKRIGLEQYFDGIFISEEIGFNKPDARFFDFVKSNIDNFLPENTLVVGDSLSSDIKGANNAGLDCCWYNPNAVNASDIAVPTYTVNDFEGILKIIGV